MDININSNIAGLVRPPSTPDTATVPASDPAPITFETRKPQPTPVQDDARASYQQAARKAIVSFANTYAISDKKFAIFKDASGQMITRYVSLRDGSVIYSPAPPSFVSPKVAINV